MQWERMPLKAKLLEDLTRYHPSLLPGTLGEVVALKGRSSVFCSMRFPEAGVLDVLWKGVEVLDEEYNAARKEYKEEKQAMAKTANLARKGVGPRGGVQYMAWDVKLADGTSRHFSVKDKKKIEEWESFFIANKVPIIVDQH